MKCKAGDCKFPSLSLLLDDGTEYSGILSGNTPALSRFRSVKLSNSMTLDEDLVVSGSTALSSAELLQKISSIKNVQSVCLGNQDNKLVVVGKASGLSEEAVGEPFKLVRL